MSAMDQVPRQPTILWQNAWILAVWKPAGMPVQPDPTGDADLLSWSRAHLGESSIQLTHRLDRPVSGVVLFGRTPLATAALNRSFRDRSVHKVYWAIVEGLLLGERVIEGMVARDQGAKKARVLPVIGEEAMAKLQVTSLAQGERYSLVQVVPSGGAFHQIRAQLSTAGWPIKGDVKYGARRGEKDRSIMLHARSITFDDPGTGQRVTVVAPAPDGSLWTALTAGLPERMQ